MIQHNGSAGVCRGWAHGRTQTTKTTIRGNGVPRWKQHLFRLRGALRMLPFLRCENVTLVEATEQAPIPWFGGRIMCWLKVGTHVVILPQKVLKSRCSSCDAISGQSWRYKNNFFFSPSFENRHLQFWLKMILSYARHVEVWQLDELFLDRFFIFTWKETKTLVPLPPIFFDSPAIILFQK
jgi:hypothetical protein